MDNTLKTLRQKALGLLDCKYAGYPLVFCRVPDIQQSYPAAGYPVMAGYLAKLTPNNKFLPEFRTFKFTRSNIHQYP